MWNTSFTYDSHDDRAYQIARRALVFLSENWTSVSKDGIYFIRVLDFLMHMYTGVYVAFEETSYIGSK